jgi:hypothetical protein
VQWCPLAAATGGIDELPGLRTLLGFGHPGQGLVDQGEGEVADLDPGDPVGLPDGDVGGVVDQGGRRERVRLVLPEQIPGVQPLPHGDVGVIAVGSGSRRGDLGGQFGRRLERVHLPGRAASAAIALGSLRDPDHPRMVAGLVLIGTLTASRLASLRPAALLPDVRRDDDLIASTHGRPFSFPIHRPELDGRRVVAMAAADAILDDGSGAARRLDHDVRGLVHL